MEKIYLYSKTQWMCVCSSDAPNYFPICSWRLARFVAEERRTHTGTYFTRVCNRMRCNQNEDAAAMMTTTNYYQVHFGEILFACRICLTCILKQALLLLRARTISTGFTQMQHWSVLLKANELETERFLHGIEKSIHTHIHTHELH